MRERERESKKTGKGKKKRRKGRRNQTARMLPTSTFFIEFRSFQIRFVLA